MFAEEHITPFAEKPHVKKPRRYSPVFAFRRIYTYADCLEWPKDFRAEIINGDIFTMPTPTPKHQQIIFNLCILLGAYLKEHPEWRIYPAPLSVRFFAQADNGARTVFEPDIIVVTKDAALGKNSVDHTPEMLVEVLSPSNADYDKKIKFEQYESAGVKEYWIVDGENRTIEVNVLDEGEYTQTVYSDGGTVPVTTLPGCKIPLNEVFAD
jgi:Uma2 family endonuclease